MNNVTVNVAVTGWHYPTREQAKAESERAKAQFGERTFSVYAAMRGDAEEGMVVFVGPEAALKRAEAEWVPDGGEQCLVRDDIGARLAERHLRGAKALVVTDDSGGYELF